MRLFNSILSRHEQGQSAIVIAGALVALIAIISLVVDGGNAFAQRRQLQNAMDAGAQAGSIQLALAKTNGQVNAAIEDYVRRNGVDPSLVNSYYVTQNGSTQVVERGTTISAYSTNQTAPTTINGRPVYGVQVEGKKQFATFFAGVVGWRQLSVGAESFAHASSPGNKGTCNAEDLFPLTVSANTFSDENRDGVVDFHFSDNEPTYAYRIWEKKMTELSNFGYVTWNGTNTVGQLTSFMTNTGLSSRWSKGDNMPYATGDLASTLVRTQLQGLTTSSSYVTVPVYDYANGTDTNNDGYVDVVNSYRIIGFARMTVVAMSAITALPGSRYVDVRFQRFVEPTGGGGCPYYGDAAVTIPPPSDLTRRLIGTVKISKITPKSTITQQNVHVPVDVVNVLDISGSMSDPFGGMTKLNAAKTALRNFNLNMLPLQGDKVALATYPRTSTGTRYNYTCTQNGSSTTYYGAQQWSALTSNIASVNTIINGLTASGYTPIGAGFQQGRTTVLGAGHSSTTPAILILASDGLANVRLNGMITGFDGRTSNSPQCNVGAVQDMLDQANIAKGDANNDGKPDVIVFTIAVGDDFNPDAMQAAATVDTDVTKPHYFRVTDATSMNNIYQQIASRVQNISSESCEVIQTEAFANGASLTIRNRDTGQQYTVQTTSTGEFVLNNVSPGTFEFTSATVSTNGFTYNVFTNGVGGAALGSNPTVVVGQGSGTYKTDLFLKTTDTITCPGS